MTANAKDAYYCALLHKGLYVEKKSSDDFWVSSCCSMERGGTNRQIDFANNVFLKEKRLQSLSGPVPECKQCWDLEKATGYSHRLGANRWLSKLDDGIDPYTTELLRFDYNVDILCNAKCIQCSSWFSSLWAAEDQQHGHAQPSRTYNIIRKNTFDSVDVSKLVHVYFNGGEPLLSDQPEAFLSKIKSQKGLETVTVDLSTNGSVMPSQSMIDLLKQCKKVGVVVSLDGVNEPFEYIRNPLIWKTVESNAARMTELADNIFVSFSNNIGTQNIDEVINIQQWYDDITKSVDFSAIYFFQTVNTLSLGNASQRLLDIWQEKFTPLTAQYPVLKDIVGMVETAKGQPDDSIWLKHLEMIDRRRNLDWRRALPNLYDCYKKIHGD